MNFGRRITTTSNRELYQNKEKEELFNKRTAGAMTVKLSIDRAHHLDESNYLCSIVITGVKL